MPLNRRKAGGLEMEIEKKRKEILKKNEKKLKSPRLPFNIRRAHLNRPLLPSADYTDF
jgi:hypothetical protein